MNDSLSAQPARKSTAPRGLAAPWGFSLIVLITLLQQYLFSGYTMDDAFISFRYARNVARGFGWVYNIGAEPVEGFTNFLWTLALVPGFFLNLEPMPVAQSLGALCSIGVLYLSWQMARAGVKHPDSLVPLWAPLLLALTGSFTYQAVTGLETHLFTLLFVGGLYYCLRLDGPSLLRSGILFALASMTRPEGLALGLFTLAVLAIHWLRRELETPALLGFFIPFAVIEGIFLIFRWQVFGGLVPNTYYAKTGGDLFEQIRQGWNYVYDFFRQHGVLLPWPLAVLPLLWHRLRWRECYLLGMSLFYLALVIYEGGDWMPLHRFIAPVLPVLFVLVAEGIEAVRTAWLDVAEKRLLPIGIGRAAGWLWAGLVMLNLVYPSIGVMQESFVRQEDYDRSHVSLGKWLEQNTRPWERIALSDIGQIGYYSDRWVIDLAGLTDPVIATSPGGLHKKDYDPEYVLNQRPEYIVLVSQKMGGRFVIRGFETDKRLYRHPRFEEEYQLRPDLCARFFYKDDYTYWIFERIPLNERISQEQS
jgi:arabinofuranosyltransferase